MKVKPSPDGREAPDSPRLGHPMLGAVQASDDFPGGTTFPEVRVARVLPS